LIRRVSHILPLLLCACTVGPDYRRPDLATPPHYAAAAAEAAADPAGELAEWWARFSDPQLSALVERALRGSRELRIAQARVREARALRGVAGAGLLPELDAVAEGSERVGEGESSFIGGLAALFEIDVFGRIRRGVEAADADTEASIEDRRAVLLAVVGEVVTSYVELRGFQGRIASVRRNLDTQRETFELTDARLQVGLASDLDVERARAQLAETAAALPPLEAQLAAARHRLAVLLGEPPAALAAELSDPAPIPVAPAEVVVGVPAELLRRRPDLNRAERELAAATARIGEATAERYPRFTLLGSIGFGSDDVAEFLSGGGAFAALGPSVSWPLFAGGRIRAQIEAQDARQEQALARYELALLAAQEEVENALVRYAREQVRRRELRAAVDANREAAELARLLYANGLAGFLDVLDAERSLLISESLLVESETSVSTELVALYVALGGGWERAEALGLP
jgi:NodT family efflux transporter outer membrane factor (OMF) lipoprotein